MMAASSAPVHGSRIQGGQCPKDLHRKTWAYIPVSRSDKPEMACLNARVKAMNPSPLGPSQGDHLPCPNQDAGHVQQDQGEGAISFRHLVTRRVDVPVEVDLDKEDDNLE